MLASIPSDCGAAPTQTGQEQELTISLARAHHTHNTTEKYLRDLDQLQNLMLDNLENRVVGLDWKYLIIAAYVSSAVFLFELILHA